MLLTKNKLKKILENMRVSIPKSLERNFLTDMEIPQLMMRGMFLNTQSETFLNSLIEIKSCAGMNRVVEVVSLFS